MPWTIPTYAGTYMGGSPSNARTALFELMRAVNERQAAINITKTQFYKADGTQAADLSMADILNIRASGVESNVEKNLKRVRDAIISMLNGGYFTEASGSAVAWTKASMETEIASDLDAGPLRPQEARYWQTMQDALDRMIYSCREVDPEFVSYIGNSRGETFSTLQDAWDDRHSVSNPTTSLDSGYWYMRELGSSWRASILTGRIYDFVVPDFLGVAVGSAYQLIHRNDSSIIVNYSVGSFDGSMSAAEALVLYAWKESVSADLSLNATTPITIQITTPEPSTVPFSGEGETRIALIKARIYIDLESVLSDQ